MEDVITIDIGNTRSKYAVFRADNIIESGVFDPYCNDLGVVLQKYPSIRRGIISSVSGKVEECLRSLCGVDVLVLGNDTRLPFSLSYKDRSRVGADRLALVAEAFAERPHEDNLIIDIGTCITYDILTSDDRHLGGPISPGIRLRFKAMNEHTALLPLCEPDADNLKLLCETTEECLQSGVINGILFEIKEFIEEYSKIFNGLNVFLSGGDNIFFDTKLKNCIFANSNFMFNGLRYILEYNENQ